MTETYEEVAVFFDVVIDKVNGSYKLGTFTSCDGLSVEVETHPQPEGGNNDFVLLLPVRLKYTTIKLTRPLGPDSLKVAAWFRGMANGFERTTGRIAALTTEGKELVAWQLDGIIPVRWQGPSFSAESPKIATETIELAHTGFTMEAGRPSSPGGGTQ
ncbi:MAG: phage tail protein [Actinomycetota bacterium]